MGSSGTTAGEPCTEVGCSSFAWCRDFADIPGECLGDACQDYNRAKAYAIVIAVVAILGLLFDVADVGLLCRPATGPQHKAVLNAAGAFIKFAGFLLCLLGGIHEFVGVAVEKECFNESGNELARDVQVGISSFLLAAAVAAISSFCLAPLSARGRQNLMGLPYAKVQDVN